jgi:hypothetical protein
MKLAKEIQLETKRGKNSNQKKEKGNDEDNSRIGTPNF